MILSVDGIDFNNIIVNSLQRKIVKESGKNGGTFLTGERFNDVRNSYYQYTLTISPSLKNKEEYEELYSLLSLPVESYDVTLPSGQEFITFKASVASIGDRCRKKLPNGFIWDSFNVTFKGTEALDL